MFPPRHIVIGVDLGKIAHYSAFVACEHHVATDVLNVLHLERPPQGTRYRRVVQGLAAWIRRLDPPEAVAWRKFHGRAAPPAPLVSVAVDATGVGESVLEMFREEPWEAALWSIVLTGPGHAHFDEPTARWMVPKADVVEDLEVRSQANPPRWYCDPALPLAKELGDELDALKATPRASGILTYEHKPDDPNAKDAASHGDLAIAAFLGAWVASRHADGGRRQIGWV